MQGRPKPIKKNKEAPKTNNAEKMRSIDDHCLKNDVFFSERIKVENQFIDNKNTFLAKGLTKAEAEKRSKEFGENKLSEVKKTHWTIKLLEEMTAPFALLLWVGGGLCFLAYGLDESDPSNLYLGIVLCVVVTLTSVASFSQNSKSESVMEGFKNFTP
jgi:magnesium-transporting ATPase (P-type)